MTTRNNNAVNDERNVNYINKKSDENDKMYNDDKKLQL